MKKLILVSIAGFLLAGGCVFAYGAVFKSTSNSKPFSLSQNKTIYPQISTTEAVAIKEPLAVSTNMSAQGNVSVTSPANSTASSTSPVHANSFIVSGAEQPAKTIAPAGAGSVAFTSFTLTAGDEDVAVTSISVQRTGLGEDGAFDSIALNDENGVQIGDEKSFNSNHEVTLGDPFIISAGTSKTFTLVGNMTGDETSYSGEMPSLSVTAVHASIPVTGSLPLVGTTQTINDTLVIGRATAVLSPEDPGVNTNRYINDTGIRFSGIRITAHSQEDLTLSSVTWTQNGTAGTEDLANITTVVNGTPYSTDTNGKTYTATFPSGITVKKGESADIYIQGDLTGTGANRTVEFDIDSSSDVGLTGNNFGFGVGLAADGNTAIDGHSVFITSDGDTDGDEGTPFFSGSIAKINAGTITSIGKAN